MHDAIPNPTTQSDQRSGLKPRISIIIPSLNHGQFIEQAICSALDQGYDNAEVMVVDGGSDDDSLDIIASYNDELTYWHSAWDSGPAEAVNAALVRATGDVVCILAADDILLPGAIEDAATIMAAGRKPDWIVGHAHRIGTLHESLGELTSTQPTSLASFLMHDSGLMPLSGSFFRKELFSDYGGFRTDLTYAWVYEMQARLLSAEVFPNSTRASSRRYVSRASHDPSPPRLPSETNTSRRLRTSRTTSISPIATSSGRTAMSAAGYMPSQKQRARKTAPGHSYGSSSFAARGGWAAPTTAQRFSRACSPSPTRCATRRRKDRWGSIVQPCSARPAVTTCMTWRTTSAPIAVGSFIHAGHTPSPDDPTAWDCPTGGG